MTPLSRTPDGDSRSLHIPPLPAGLPSTCAARTVWAALHEVQAERDRLRADADKWHQEWVYAHDRMDRLRAAIEDYLLWEPGRAGHAAASRRLKEALDA